MERKEKDRKIIIKKYHGGSGTGAIYGLGVIGAFVYFYPTIHTFTEGLMAVIKSFGWPALFVFKALELLKF